jgi:uncharacterized protein
MVAEAETVLDEMVSRIVEAVHPDRIILFGSHARGDSGPDSDVDLLLVGPSDQPRIRRAAPAYRALRGLGVPKDIVWWTEEEIADWRAVTGHFINRVLREGRVIYERAS